jgi:hypothetical protein
MMSAESSGTNTVPISRTNTYDTLEEPVYMTIWRDVKAIGNKIRIVLIPYAADLSALRDWDLWGPLLLCLILAICLTISTKTDQAGSMFGGIFVIVWMGSAIVTLNGQLLGGKISFFMSVCVLGYCIFPLVVCSIIFIFLRFWVIRFLLIALACTWSCFASMAFLSGTVAPNRKLLSVYPIGLFYIFIGWLIFIM